MRALVISDIHGNLQALEAVLRVARSRTGGGFDQLWNLGDVVGYGARPNEVIDTLRALETERSIHVRGNHDRVCCGLSSSQGFNPIAAAAAAWTRQHLRADNREWLRELPMGPCARTVRRCMRISTSPRCAMRGHLCRGCPRSLRSSGTRIYKAGFRDARKTGRRTIQRMTQTIATTLSSTRCRCRWARDI